MILPGISGSFMLLVIGVYPTVISAISNLQLGVMAVVGVGIVIGIVAMSKIINFFLTRYYTGTFAIIIGLVIGSIVVVFPGWPTGTSDRKSTRLNSSHVAISYAVFCLKKKTGL